MLGRHFLTCLGHVVRHVNVASKLPTPTSDKPNVCRSKPKMEAVSVDKKINKKKKNVNSKGHVKVVAK
jgi:hypothetical protein